MSMEHPDLSAIGKAFEEKIYEYDGAPGQWRVTSRVGETRRDAMGSGGSDGSQDIEEGDIAAAIVEYAIARLRAHADGPAGYLWLALRRAGKAGNVLTSPPIRCGGEDAHASLTATRGDAIVALAGMAPKALELMERITVRSLSFAERSQAEATQAKVNMAHIMGSAEAGDETAKYQAMGEAASSLGPVLGQAVAAWRASLSGGAPPATAADAVAAFNDWPDEAKEGLLAALRAHEAEAGAEAQSEAAE